jgi:hypothetical protein
MQVAPTLADSERNAATRMPGIGPPPAWDRPTLAAAIASNALKFYGLLARKRGRWAFSSGRVADRFGCKPVMIQSDPHSVPL